METPTTHRELVQRAPSTVVVLAATVVVLAVLGSVTVLVLNGKDAATITDLIERGLVMLSALTGAGGLAYGASAARSAAQAQKQTNGSLDPRMRAAVGAELDARLADAIAAGVAQAAAGPAPVIPSPRDPVD